MTHFHGNTFRLKFFKDLENGTVINSSAGKRRIRVHTLCLPVVSQLSDVYAGADVQAITCLLANMGKCVA